MTLRDELFGHGYLAIKGPDCEISLEPRPHYCDRGEWIAQVLITGDSLKVNVDGADCWPRMYFNLDFAKAEIEQWLIRRKQVPFGSWEIVGHELP